MLCVMIYRHLVVMVMVVHSYKCSDKVPGINMEKIFPWQSEVFKDILEEIAPILRNMDAETLKQRSDV